MKFKILLPLLILFMMSESIKAQPNYVAGAGLRAYWPFNTQNAANDIGPSAYPSLLYGPTQPALVNNRFGISGNAYNFNGTNWIETPFSGILGDSARAVAFWARTSANSNGGMYPVGWGSNGSGDRFACGIDYPANQPFVGAGFSIQPYVSNSPTCDNKWHHYVFQFSTIYGTQLSDVKVWQDAVQIFTTTVSTYNPNQILNTLNSFNVTFGKIIYSASPAHYTGDLDEIGIWNRLLTQCEISDLYYADLAIGSMTFNTAGYTGSVNNLAQLTQTMTGNSQFSLTIAQSSYSGTGVTFSSGLYKFNSPPTLAAGNYIISHTYTLQGGCVRTATQTIKVLTGVGIGDMNAEGVWNPEIYPNPATGNIMIATKIENEHLFLRVTDISGKEVYSRDIYNNTPMDISFLENAVYVIEITTSSHKIAHKKLIVSR